MRGCVCADFDCGAECICRSLQRCGLVRAFLLRAEVCGGSFRGFDRMLQCGLRLAGRKANVFRDAAGRLVGYQNFCAVCRGRLFIRCQIPLQVLSRRQCRIKGAPPSARTYR